MPYCRDRRHAAVRRRSPGETMLREKFSALKFSKTLPWIWLSVIVSELFTAFLNTVQSYGTVRRLSPDLLVMGRSTRCFYPDRRSHRHPFHQRDQRAERINEDSSARSGNGGWRRRRGTGAKRGTEPLSTALTPDLYLLAGLPISS